MALRRPIRIAVQLHPIHATYAAIRRAVAQVDDSGADILFNSDHFFPSVGDDTGPCFEAWTLLGAWAEQTRRVQLGVSVTGVTYRNANLLADMARTVDHVSGGRAILGLGSGWFMKDHTEYGFEFPPQERRLRDFEQALDTIAGRLAVINPQPVRGRLPIMVGNGGDRKPPAVVARHADIWLDFKTPDLVALHNAELDDACRAMGRDPDEIERGVAVTPGGLSGVEAFLEAGCTLFMIRYAGPDYDLSDLPAWTAWRDALNAA